MADGFSDAWLALREPADARARAPDLLAGLAAWLSRADAGSDADAREVVDLGAGSGANLRWLAPRLAALGLRDQRWTCIDHDPRLRAALPRRCADWAAGQGARVERTADGLALHAPDWRCRVRTLDLDLAGDLERLPVAPGALVTASALLDLVAADWLAALLARLRATGCACLFALTYDGRCTLTPTDADDAALIALVNAHQRRDKGFGPALGPAAPAHLHALATAAGWHVTGAPSDWVVGADAPALAAALCTGWAQAAREQAPAEAARVAAWLDRRNAAIAAGRLRLRVGHQDLLALPAAGTLYDGR